MPQPDKRLWRFASRILPLALCLCLVPHAAFSSGELPSLDTSPASEASGITPISELTALPANQPALDSGEPTSIAPEQALQPAQPEPARLQPLIPQTPAEQPKQQANSAQSQKAQETEDQPQPRLEPHAEIPAVENKPPQKPRFSFANLGLSNPFESEKAIKPISYSPLPGIAVFAVVKHGNETAFGDLPLVFAREYAIRMEQKVPETKVYNPIYTVDELRIKGLGHVYDQVMTYYRKAGRPEPTAMDYLLKQLSLNGQSVSRVVFVEADLDLGRPDASTGLMEKVKSLMTDDTPKHMKYFVHSRLQIFDAEKPDFPMVWAGSWERSVRQNQLGNVTPSVFSDSDSLQAFSGISRQMSRELLYVTPKAAYMAPLYDTQVQGSLVTGGKEQPFPNFTEARQTRNPLTNENKQAIQRILQRQNSVSP